MVIKEIIGEVLLDPLHKIKGSKGSSLYQISEKKTIVVFLRHFGCIFCRETMRYLAANKDRLLEEGINIAIVHQSDEVHGSFYLHKYGLGDLEHFSDPDLHLYKAFGLKEGKFRQLAGLKVWKGGVRAVLKSRVFMGRVKGKAAQLGGFFIFQNGKVEVEYRCQHASDIPDLYLLLGEANSSQSSLLDTA